MNIQRFNDAMEAFDKENARDPNSTLVDGQPYPKELLYAQRMTTCLNLYSPNASEALQLAARCQHICRWEIPRATFPEGRRGYLLWRMKLKEMHASTAEAIMLSLNYNREIIGQVKKMLLKKELENDPEVQSLQDVVCIVFLKYYFNGFAAKHTKDKVRRILEKTMGKMSEKGIDFAKRIENAADFLAFL